MKTERNANEAPQSVSAENERSIASSALSSQQPVDQPIITLCLRSPQGLPAFAESSPYLFPKHLELFIRAMRDDIALMRLEPARKVFRRIDSTEKYPLPESCAPYVDANSLGFYLRPLLPLVFVRTSKGEPLMEARVALKYLRENAHRFAAALEILEHYAYRIFREEEYEKFRPQYPQLFSDVAQPYNAFTSRHVSIRTGLWVHTPPGMSTVLGPPINQTGPLSVLTGAIETDWHHFQLFVVTIFPEFEGQVLVIEPDETIAQFYFVNRSAQEHAEIHFSRDDPGAERSYRESWDKLSTYLEQSGKSIMMERKGVASVEIGCPHCYTSVTAASEQGVPEGHTSSYGFHPAYKVLKSAYRSLGSSSSEDS